MTKDQLLIVDPICPHAYSPATLDLGGLGGTEATVTRIAEALSTSFKDGVVVAQHCRTHTTLKNALYSPLRYSMMKDVIKAIVVLRHPFVAMNFKAAHKNTPVYLWVHDLAVPEFVRVMPDLKEAGVELICVSHYHRQQLIEMSSRDTQIHLLPKVHVLYNPIADDLKPDDTPVDRDKLVFFSSPHKGLRETIEAFQALRRFRPEFKLVLANPGYMPDSPLREEGIINVGPLPHSAMMKQVRSAFCVFYPNYTFPETFGLVFAEANAVGTPVLAHRFGAASEVLNGDFQLTDAKQLTKVVDKVMLWHKDGRPKVEGKEQFRLKSVTAAWKRLLGVSV